jgi:hypothetical protein
MKKRRLKLNDLRVESVSMSSEVVSRGTVHAHGPETILTCPWTFDCMWPTATPSCPPTATQGPEYTCAQGCMVPRTEARACCTQGECTIYICEAT